MLATKKTILAPLHARIQNLSLLEFIGVCSSPRRGIEARKMRMSETEWASDGRSRRRRRVKREMKKNVIKRAAVGCEISSAVHQRLRSRVKGVSFGSLRTSDPSHSRSPFVEIDGIWAPRKLLSWERSPPSGKAGGVHSVAFGWRTRILPSVLFL